MDIKQIISALAPYKKIIFITLACLIGLLVFWFALGWFSGYLEKRGIEKDKEAINSLQQGANDIKSNLANLQINEAILETETNVTRNSYANAQGATNAAREETNKSLENLNLIRITNYANTTLQNARDAQCRAYPESCR